nr:LPXTG cell wall anchor domain-containing protein [Streptococcus moroccensis]
MIDAQDKELDITHAALVTLPIDSGKIVEAVLYLPTDDSSVSLEFTQTIAYDEHGHAYDAVVFWAEHFSKYAVVYASTAASSSTQTSGVSVSQSSTTSPVLPKTGDSGSLLSFLGLGLFSSLGLLKSKKQKEE